MKSAHGHGFGTTPALQMTRSRFDTSSRHLTTFDGDYLIPLRVIEILPGTTVDMSMEYFLRLNTPLYPTMDNIFFDTFAFYCPMRLLWDNTHKFFGETVDPGDSTDYVLPVMDHTASTLAATGFGEQTLYDYMGLPTKVVAKAEINALPIRMYNLVWNQWFRDQNLQDSVVVDTGDADSDDADYVLLKRGKRHDYFTACLPFANGKNNTGTDVQLPLGTEADIFFEGDFDAASDADNYLQVLDANGNERGLMSSNNYVEGHNADIGNYHLKADLSTATAATLKEFWQAQQVQKMYDLDARSGTRFREHLLSHWGVRSADRSLQVPEYLAGSSKRINVTSVANTSPIKAADAPGGADLHQGELAGFGTGSGNLRFIKSFEEYGYVLIMGAARADLTYQEGIARMWTRQSRLDFPLPLLSGIGEQTVRNDEIYCDASANDLLAFGYQERFAEMKYGRSIITGRMRSNATTSLDPWHLSQEFGGLPVLNASFIQSTTPWDRVLAVTTEPDFTGDFFFREYQTHCLPTFSIPGKHIL